MDKKLLAVCVLTVSAVALMIADFVTPPAARADTTVSGNGYVISTGKLITGGEGLYIIDNQSGNLVVFVFDPATRSLRPKTFRPVADAMNLPAGK